MLKAALLVLVVFRNSEGAFQQTESGKEMLFRSASRFEKMCLEENDVPDSMLDIFRAMIINTAVVMSRTRNEWKLRNIARDMEEAECVDLFEDNGGLVFGLAIHLLKTPNIKALVYGELFESHNRQGIFATLLDVSERVGAERSEILSCWTSGDFTMPDHQLQEAISARRKSVFECPDVVPIQRSYTLDRLYSRSIRDVWEALDGVGIRYFVKSKKKAVDQKFSNSDFEVASGSIEESVVHSLTRAALEIIFAVPSNLQFTTEMTHILSTFYDSLDEFLDHVKSPQSLDGPSRLTAIRNRVTGIADKIHENFHDTTSLIDFNGALVDRLEVAFEIDQDAQLFLLTDVVTLVDRYLACLTKLRFANNISRTRISRALSLLNFIVDFAIQVVQSDYRSVSRVALREWITSISTTSWDLGKIFADPDVAIINFGYTLGRDFNIRIWDFDESLRPSGWSANRLNLVAEFIDAKVRRGKYHKSDAPILAAASEERLLQARRVVERMEENGITGTELVPLIDPIEWTIQFIKSRPDTNNFANWVANLFTGRDRKRGASFGFPAKYEALADRVKRTCRSSSEWFGYEIIGIEKCNIEYKWAITLPAKLMVLEVETPNTIAEQYANSLLELLEIVLHGDVHDNALGEAHWALNEYAKGYERQFNLLGIHYDSILDFVSGEDPHLEQKLPELRAFIEQFRAGP